MVRITKYVHSCLVVETRGLTALFDPGIYSFESKLFNPSSLTALDYIFITHEHADHFHKPFVEELLARFPSAKIVSTLPVVEELKSLNAQVADTDSADYSLLDASHESLPMGQAPVNMGFQFAETITHPGDSHSFTQCNPVLAMPMTAPWGSMSAAVGVILKLRPKVVVPIHDWHWKPEALQAMYERIKEALTAENIDFILPIDGTSIELNID